MKKHDLTNLGRLELETLYSELSLHESDMRGTINCAKSIIAERFAPPRLIYPVRENIRENIRTLEAQCIEQEARLGDKAPTFEFSASLKRGGTRSSAFAVDVSAPRNFRTDAVYPSGKKPTLTDKILKARGVTTLAELNKLPPPAGTLD